MLTPVSQRPPGSLSRVLEDLGPTLLDPVCLKADLDSAIGGVVIHEPQETQEYPPRAVVLGVSARDSAEIAQLLGELQGHGVAALIVRGPVEENPRIEAAAATAGIALLALTPGATWAQLAAMLRTLIAEENVGDEQPETLAGMPSGDLFALANAISTLLDAPVTIEDRRCRILAFSGNQSETDASRVASILGRQVPAEHIRIMEERGVFKRLYNQYDPVYFDPITLEDDEADKPRVAVAVRAGEEILGSMWAVVGEPLSEERMRAFRDSAKLVALHMLRLRAGTDAERRLRADLVGTALSGGSGAADALNRLGLGAVPTLVLAMGLPVAAASNSIADHARLAAERERLTNALALHLTAVQPRSAVALLGDVAYAILPAHGTGRDAAERSTRTAATFLERTGSGTGGPGAVIAVGTVADEPSGLGRSRANADRALRVLFTGRTTRRVAAIFHIYVEALLLEIGDIAAANGDALIDSVARLVAHDDAHGSRLVETLRAWLDAFGDVIAASTSLYVHPNTFRYRLRRVAAVGQLDLQDPSDRFAAMLQLRMMSAQRPVSEA